MKIKMLTLQAGPSGVRQAGKIYKVPEQVSKKEANELIKGNFAEEVKEKETSSTDTKVVDDANKPRVATRTSNRTANKPEAVDVNAQTPAPSDASVEEAKG